MLNLLIIVPFIVAAVLSLLMKDKFHKYIRYVALAASIISLILITLAYYNPVTAQSLTWFNFSGYQFVISTSTMPLNMLLLLLVGAVAPFIIVYSIGFMDVPSEQSRYYAELCLFAAAMLLFAMAADFITLFIGWELLGVTSYLLIGFWYKREGTAQSARKAITTILIGDILMLIAMIIIWNGFHTFSFASILSQINSSTSTTSMEIALIFIMLAAFTKSAQFPFHEWLPDAMKGPTPVSAFLHSSTMVKAGIFLIAVLLPFFIAYNLTYLLLIFGIITCFIGVTNALAETHLKRILAYSTIEDLGLMFVALGLGSVIAAMMLFIVQTFYKALLFMNAGAIIKANNNEENIEKIYNMPSIKTFIPTIVGVASLAGLFPFSGFFGKAAVLSSASGIVYYLLLIVEFLSTIYIFRWLLVPIRKRNEHKEIQVKLNYKQMPKSMIIAIYSLTVLVLVASISYFYVPKYLSSITPSILFSLTNNDIFISIGLFSIGFVISFIIFYWKNYSSIDNRNILYKILYNNVIINKFYYGIAAFVASISRAIDEFDYSFYFIIKGGAHGINALSNWLKKLENGNTNTYLAFFVIGFIVIFILFVL